MNTSERTHAWTWQRVLFAESLVFSALTAGALFVGAHSGHRRAPTPQGMVFRIETREVRSPFDAIVVKAAHIGRPAIIVEAPIHDENAWITSTERRTYAYPEGTLLETKIILSLDRSPAPPPAPFDFDGDGTVDRVLGSPSDRVHLEEHIDDGIVRVRSGATGAVLFEDHDEIEYEFNERAFPLGDLDGDGYAELALLHPRMNRSAYDLELWDLMLGTNSWVTIVSGSRVAKH